MSAGLWKYLTQSIRSRITRCQWCNIHKTKTKTGYLECHHLGTRGNGNNADYRLCPLNLIVVCQPCHVMLEPFAKVTVQLTYCDEIGTEIEEVECCGKGFDCTRWRESL